MTPEHERLLKVLDKVLTNIEDVICDPDVPDMVKTEIYNKQIEILDRYSLVKE